MQEKQRLDVLLKENNFFESREKAKQAILSEKIKISGKICTNPAQKFVWNNNLEIEIIGEPNKYVSRGAYKLEKAISFFNVDVKDKIAVDIGASTGGFSDVLIQNGIKKIYCIDVGKNQLHDKIRNSSKTIVYEQTDFRTINQDLVSDASLIVIDVSFISIAPIIYKIKQLFFNKEIYVVSLIKPQFECGIEVAKKYRGVIKNKNIHKEVINKVIDLWNQNGFNILNLTYSPIKGGDGNIEYLLYTCLNKKCDSVNLDIDKIINDGFEQI